MYQKKKKGLLAKNEQFVYEFPVAPLDECAQFWPHCLLCVL